MFLRDRSLVHHHHLHSFTSPSWSRKQVLVPKLAAPSRLPSSSPASNHFLFLFERIIFSSASSRLLLPLLHVVVAFMLSLLARTATTASPILLILAVAEWTSSAVFSPQNQHQLFIFDLSFLLLWVPSSPSVSAYYCSLLLLLNNSVRVTVVAVGSLLLSHRCYCPSAPPTACLHVIFLLLYACSPLEITAAFLPPLFCLSLLLQLRLVLILQLRSFFFIGLLWVLFLWS